jgi:heme exporter protein A
VAVGSGFPPPEPLFYPRALTQPGPDVVAEHLACQRGERVVFTGLSFRLPAGGALLLTGANGSGKTSLLRILATLIMPAAGQLLWGATPVETDAAGYRAQLDFVGHQEGLKQGLTPRETLMFWAALRGIEPRRSRHLVEAALGAFALDSAADWPCRWLSAGQRRRTALARLVAAPASIWLLDEPTSALDGENQSRLERIIAEHRAAGGRVVVASHTPIELGTAAALALDAFAPLPDDAAAL